MSKVDAQKYHKIQSSYLKKGVSIMVKHYESGTFSFIIQIHNGDATGWTKISGFLNKSSYNYIDALIDGIEWYENSLLEQEKEKNTKIGETVQVVKGSEFGSMVKYTI